MRNIHDLRIAARFPLFDESPFCVVGNHTGLPTYETQTYGLGRIGNTIYEA
jgi:hypothetical protein